jgi:hypothetical protein
MTFEDRILDVYRRKEEQILADAKRAWDDVIFDPSHPEGDFSATTLACNAASVTAEDIRKAINEIKNLTPPGRPRKPPAAIVFYGDDADFLKQFGVPYVMESPASGFRDMFKGQFEGIPIIRMPSFRYMSGADAPPVKRVVWPDLVTSEPVPAWQYGVLAAVMALILVLMGGAV